MASTLSYFMPLLSFLLVFIVTYAILAKTKILGGNSFIHLFLSFVVSIIFIISPSAQKFAMVSTPWIAVFIVILFFILLMLVFVHGNLDDVVKNPIVPVAIVGVMLVIFIIASVNVFGPLISSYLPGGSEAGMTEQQAYAKHFFTNPAVIGAVILLILAAIASWVLMK